MRVGARGHRLLRTSFGHGAPRQERHRRRSQNAVGRRPAPEHRCVPLELVGRAFPLRANGNVPRKPVFAVGTSVPVERRGRLPNGAGARGVRAALFTRLQGVRAQPRAWRKRVPRDRRRPCCLQAGRVRRSDAVVACGRGPRVVRRRQVAVLHRVAADGRTR